MSSSPSVGFISLGCPKALVDSEQIISELKSEGYEINNAYDSSDIVIVNTCGFIDDAVEESMQTIQEALNENGKVIVTGCLGAKGSIVEDHFPDLLAVTGPHSKDAVMKAVHQALPPKHDPFVDLLPPGGIKLTPRHYAYLKISEGCNHRCSFCIIPSLRGDLVSRPVNEILDEAQALVDAGVKELLVVSQDTSAYGIDVRFKPEIHGGNLVRSHITDLAGALGELDAWVRMHYIYPYPHVDKLIPLMAENRILPYLDIPFQHASPRILKDMRRPAHAEKVLHRIKQWRADCPDITLRSTFIVGFPGETEEDFNTLLDFIDEAQLDRVGCFAYSAVDGAKANELSNAIDEDVKQDRLAQFMQRQAIISADKLQAKIGKTLEVLIDQVGEDGAIGRSKADAPEIDGQVHIFGDTSQVRPGDFVDVLIEDADEHDLQGQFV
ncbi:MAG: ribosomal protein S12 methylthiotransferase [Saprospiraceae bacterium]|jgi:ribosomal protein S12 methylthiotransferase